MVKASVPGGLRISSQILPPQSPGEALLWLRVEGSRRPCLSPKNFGPALSKHSQQRSLNRPGENPLHLSTVQQKHSS